MDLEELKKKYPDERNQALAAAKIIKTIKTGLTVGQIYLIERSLVRDIPLINHNKTMGNTDVVRFCLENEYGYLLSQLENKKYRLIKIKSQQIVFPQSGHQHSLDKQAIEQYRQRIPFLENNDLRIAQGVVHKVNNHYKVIDGYHRLQAAKIENFDPYVWLVKT